MAAGLSSSFEINGTKNITGRISWSETYDVATNTHVISITKFEVKSSGHSGYTYYPDGSIKVNGSEVASFDSVMGSHNVRPGLNSYDTVDAHDGYAPSPWNSGSIIGNGDGSCSITISVDVYGWTAGGEQVGANGWRINGSQTITLTTIPRASSISSVGNVNIGSACNVKWIPLSTSFSYKLKFSIGNWNHTTGAISPNSTSEYTYTGYSIALDAANQLPSAASGTMTATLYTYSNSSCTEQIGSVSTKNFTVTVPTTIVPTVSSCSAEIVNSNSVINGWGVAVAGYTKVKITASAAGAYSSTISSFTISDGYSATQNGTSLSYTGDVISSSGSKTFGVVAKDSRGRNSAKSTTSAITFYPYSKPSVDSFTVTRSTSDQSKVVVKANWSYSSVNNKNSASGILYYKKSTATSWTSYGTIPINTSTTLTINFDTTISYNFKVVVTDSLSNSAQEEAFASTIKVLLDLRAGGKGLGIGKICESDSMEVALDAKFYGAIYINGVSLDDYIKSIVG